MTRFNNNNSGLTAVMYKGKLFFVKRTRTKSVVPPSPAQLAQNSKFSLAVSFLCPVKEVVKIGYPKLKKPVLPMNVASRQIFKEAIKGAYPDFEIDCAKVKISKGNLDQGCNMVMAALPDRKIQVGWDSCGFSTNEHPKDSVYLVLYNENRHQFLVHDKATRGDGNILMEMPFLFGGDKIHGWVFFTSALERKLVSSSEYLDAVVLGI